jgi:monoterpene epsilon-lactone hydrolase
MIEGLDPATPLPDYARRIDWPGGAPRRWWLHASLKLAVKRIPLLGADIGRLRAVTLAWDARLARPDPQVRRTAVVAEGFSGEWLEVPQSRAERVLLYLHGGAFMFRFPAVHARLVARLCRRLGARALMVDYRLAPEAPFPAAPDDCHAAYRWLLAGGQAPRDIALGGDSAGGNLALVTLQRIRTAGEPLPACAVLLSPVVDFTLSSRSVLTHEASDPMFRLAGLVAMRGFYAPPERYLDPDVSPLYGDFAGLPPLLFQVGGIEMLCDESVRAAARAHAAGVAVELEIWEHMAHVFQALPVPQARAALDRIGEFVGRHTGWSPATAAS